MDQKKLKELRDYYDSTDTSDEIKDAELDDTIVHNRMVGITVRLPADTLQQVRELGATDGIKPTALIRRWVEDRLKSEAVRPAASGCSVLFFRDSHVVIGGLRTTSTQQASNESAHDLAVKALARV